MSRKWSAREKVGAFALLLVLGVALLASRSANAPLPSAPRPPQRAQPEAPPASAPAVSLPEGPGVPSEERRRLLALALTDGLKPGAQMAFEVGGEGGTILFMRVKPSECDRELVVGALLSLMKAEGFIARLRNAGFVGVACERGGKLIGERLPE